MNLIELLLYENIKFSRKKLREETIESSDEEYYFTSDKVITAFDLNNSVEIGLHCGTIEHAIRRGKKYLHKIVIKTPYKSLDLPRDITTSYSSLEFLNELYRIGIVDDSENQNLIKEYRDAFNSGNPSLKISQIYSNLLLSKGFDVITYPNNVEVKFPNYEDPSRLDKSLCILNGSIVKSIERIPKSSVINN